MLLFEWKIGWIPYLFYIVKTQNLPGKKSLLSNGVLMKKLLVIGLMSSTVFFAIHAMERKSLVLLDTPVLDAPDSAEIINTLEDEIEVKFEYSGTPALKIAPAPAEIITIPAQSKEIFSFGRIKGSRKTPATVTITILPPKTLAQQEHMVASGTVTKKFKNWCFKRMEVVPSSLSTAGFDVKIEDCGSVPLSEKWSRITQIKK